jgi:hypothetical protein
MLKESQTETFGCFTDFSHLNGREKPYVIVGDNPDARIANFLFRSWVAHNWPSQWHTRYRAGYIEFENGKKFDLANQTIRGESVFLFPDTPEIHILWLRQTLGSKIKHCVDNLPPKDKFAATQQIQKFVDSATQNHPFGKRQVLILSALSVSQLEDLAEQFSEGRNEQTVTGSPAAG